MWLSPFFFLALSGTVDSGVNHSWFIRLKSTLNYSEALKLIPLWISQARRYEACPSLFSIIRPGLKESSIFAPAIGKPYEGKPHVRFDEGAVSPI